MNEYKNQIKEIDHSVDICHTTATVKLPSNFYIGATAKILVDGKYIVIKRIEWNKLI